jgi:hypothetical protein
VTGLSVNAPIAGGGDYIWTIQALGYTADGSYERAGAVAEAGFTARSVNTARLIAPVNGTQVEAARADIYANWSVNEALRSSRLVVSTSPSPLEGSAVVDAMNPLPPYKLPDLLPGRYYWTVTAETEDGFSASARTNASFVVTPHQVEPITLVSPPNGAQLSFADSRRVGLIEWTLAVPSQSTRFVLSRNPDPLSGTPVLEIQNPPSSLNLPALESGRYYWTIAGTNVDNLPINARAPFSFNLLPAPPLASVSYIAPVNGAVLSPDELRENRGLGFVWQPVEDANEYVLTLRDARGNLLASSPPLAATTFTISDLRVFASGGVYRWSVTAQRRGEGGRLERTGPPPSPSVFTLDLTRPERLEANPPGVMYGKQ